MALESRLLPATLQAELRRRPGYWLYAAHLLTVWGIAASNAFLGFMMLYSGIRRRRLPWSWRRNAVLLAPAGVYFVLLAASVAFSLDPAESGDHLREGFSLVTLFLGVVLVRGERDVRRLFDLLIVMVVLLAVHGIVQYTFTDYGDLFNRIRGPFSHYQTYAGVLLIGDLLLLARTVSGDGWKKPWHWLALGLVNWALMLSLTRGSWVAVGVTFTAYALVRWRRFFVVYLAAATAAAFLATSLVPDAGERLRSIADLGDASNYDRLCMLDAGLYMVAERPLFGLGPGMVKERYPIYRHPAAPRFNVPHLHNSFLELAAERGLTSLVAYLWLMAAGLALAYRAYRREGGPRGPRADLHLGVFLVLVGFNLAGLFEDNWRDTEVQRLVLFLLATPLCLAAKDDTDEPPTSQP
jgi:O-antigen ligase